MRKIVSFVLLAATAATPLVAQDRGPGDRQPRVERSDTRGDRGDRGDIRQGRPDGRDGQRQAWRDGRNGRDDWRDGRDGRDGRVDRRDDRRDWRDDRRGNNDNRYGNGGYANGGRGDGRWNNGWRNDRRYNWQGYRSSNRNLYRMPRYAAPRGYASGYSRWSPGHRVQPYFYGSSYWISDPYRYRLPPANGGYRWVRYYDDVALVDTRSGLVEDIIYSFFF